MRLFNQLFRGRFVNVRKMALQLHGKPKSALVRSKCDVCSHLNRIEFLMFLPGDIADRTGKTSRISRREKLFRVRSTWFSRSTHFFRNTQIEIDNAV